MQLKVHDAFRRLSSSQTDVVDAGLERLTVDMLHGGRRVSSPLRSFILDNISTGRVANIKYYIYI